MLLGKRKFNHYVTVLSHKETYSAVFNTFKVVKNPVRVLFDELGGIQRSRVYVKTPLGVMPINLYDRVDLSTVFGIFCREDYNIDSSSKVIIDIGANIGVASLYFLTRNARNFVYAFEPVPSNIEKYHSNLHDFSDRFELSDCAVSDKTGNAEFGIEPTGKFGGMCTRSDSYIDVKTVAINDILETIISKHGKVDCIKIDVEGSEYDIISSIDQSYWPRINMMYSENSDSSSIMPKHFTRSWRYNVECLRQQS
jgi:FkbM family methyltransferase